MLAEGLREASGEHPPCHVCPDLAEATVRLRSLVQAGDMVLIKGSRGERMERILSMYPKLKEG